MAGWARYAIPTDHAFGVSLAQLKILARQMGPDHRLALALWRSGWRDARMLACLVDDPAQVTPAQMDRWCRDFDNWGICDTACFALFDRTAHAWTKVRYWSRLAGEYQRRAAFALLWGLTVHDKAAPDRRYLAGLALIRAAATDDRRYVRMAVSMALRATGKRNPALNRAALAVARRLAESADAASRRTGKEALRELSSPSVHRRLQAKRAKSRP